MGCTKSSETKKRVSRTKDGGVYFGMFNDDLTGKGKFTFPPGNARDAQEYEGSFLKGKRHGKMGTMVWIDGAIYTGQWFQGDRHGKGKPLEFKKASFSASVRI